MRFLSRSAAHGIGCSAKWRNPSPTTARPSALRSDWPRCERDRDLERVRSLPVVVPEDVLVQVGLQPLLGHSVEHAAKSMLHGRPESFMVCVCTSPSTYTSDAWSTHRCS